MMLERTIRRLSNGKRHFTLPLFDKVQLKLSAIRLALFAATCLAWILIAMLIAYCLQLLSQQSLIASVFAVALAATLVWAFNPRFDTPPPTELCVNPHEFPAIYEIVRQIAARYDVTMPKIVMTQQYTVGFGRFGWRHEPVLYLGHGLLSVATRYETMILIAHEMHHIQNGAWAKSRIIKVTRNGLNRLTLSKNADMTRLWFRVYYLLCLPIHIVAWPLKLLSAWELRLLEYEADQSALAFGTIEMMEKLLQKCSYGYIADVQRAYISAEAPAKYASLRKATTQIKRDRFALLWQAIVDADARPFDSHPTVRERLARGERRYMSIAEKPITRKLFTQAHEELARWPIWLDEMEQRLLVQNVC